MAAASRNYTRALITICLASAGWGFGFGLGAPLASLWLRDAGHAATLIGLNTAIYYMGIAVAAPTVPLLMRRYGRGCPAAGMAVSGLCVAIFPWADLGGWFGLRAVNGVAGALALIPMETLINQVSPSAARARNFGFYAFALAGGWALGNLVGLQMYGTAPRTAFVLGGIVSVAAALIYWIGMPPVTEQPPEATKKYPLELRRHALSYGSAWSQGFLEGGMVGLLPLYLLSVGFSEDSAAWLLSGIMIGVILFQVPLAWLADRFGRTAVLLCCYAATVASLWAAPAVSSRVCLAVSLFTIGACSGAFYPLGLAILGERVPASAVPRASAWYLAINCLGSLTGPALTGAVMERFGNRAMFPAGLAAVVGVLVVWLAVRRVADSPTLSAEPEPEQAEAA